jgi:hypothetical protein
MSGMAGEVNLVDCAHFHSLPYCSALAKRDFRSFLMTASAA